MKKKPGQWEFIATVLVLLACAAWTIYEYRQAPEKIPFEPVIATATSLIALLGLLGYTRFGKKQVSEKPSDIEPALHQNPVTNISDLKNAAFQSPIQAQKVHFGDVINYEGKPIPRALTKAPFVPETFLGREADLRRIRERLLAPDGHFLLLVNGEGGIGKTTLASKYYHDYQREYAHTAWLLSEKSIANALLLLAEPLGLQFDERMGTEDRLDLLLAAMADLEKPCLLVLDNANELSDLDANYQHLRRLSNVHLLLTTRISNFEKAETLSITGLPETEALALFEGYYRPLGEEERALFFQIREAVGGNTLVIELLAKNLALFNQLKTNYTLSTLLADLQEKGLLRLSRSQEVRTDYQSTTGKMRREKPEDIIAAMYDLGELPQEEVALLSVFAVLPAESIGFETLERLLPSFSVGVNTKLSFWKKILTQFSKAYKTKKNLSPEAFERVLTSLAQKGWIEYNETETTFKCSPVVQEVTKLKSQDLAAACRPLVEALNRELDREVLHIDNYKHSGLFARYAETVVSVLHEPDYDLGTLCQNIGGFHTATGDLDKAIRAYQKMADIFSALFREAPDNAAFKNGLAISYSKLGDTQSALGNLEQALTFFEQYNQLEKELYEAYPQNV
ncbi:MAG: tetratricopeptide repeat protein, partial [Saprospiraceae bacterium]|nr:tetratricopeptide repeat protein [Saprospiraceae bacterium]